MRRYLPTVLFAFGYPVAVVVIAFFKRVVRERKLAWFASHQVAMAAIVAGWSIRGRASPVVVNGIWFVVAAAWWVLGGRGRDSELASKRAGERSGGDDRS